MMIDSRLKFSLFNFESDCVLTSTTWTNPQTEHETDAYIRYTAKITDIKYTFFVTSCIFLSFAKCFILNFNSSIERSNKNATKLIVSQHEIYIAQIFIHAKNSIDLLNINIFSI